MTYVSKSTIGDFTKTAKEAATKKGLMKTDNNQGSKQSMQPSDNALVTHAGGKDFLSSFSSEINGIASSTSSMFSDFFGKSKLAHTKIAEVIRIEA